MQSRRQLQELEESKLAPQDKRERNPQSLSPDSRQPQAPQEQIHPNFDQQAASCKVEGPLNDLVDKLEDIQQKLRTNFSNNQHQLQIATQNLQKVISQANFSLKQLGEPEDNKIMAYIEKCLSKMTAAQQQVEDALTTKIKEMALANERTVNVQSQQQKNDQKKKKKQKNKKKAKEQDADEYLDQIIQLEMAKSNQESDELVFWLEEPMNRTKFIDIGLQHHHDIDMDEVIEMVSKERTIQDKLQVLKVDFPRLYIFYCEVNESKDRFVSYHQDCELYKTNGKAERYGQYIFGKMIYMISKLRKYKELKTVQNHDMGGTNFYNGEMYQNQFMGNGWITMSDGSKHECVAYGSEGLRQTTQSNGDIEINMIRGELPFGKGTTYFKDGTIINVLIVNFSKPINKHPNKRVDITIAPEKAYFKPKTENLPIRAVGPLTRI